MLRASRVELLLTAADLTQTLLEYSTGRADGLEVLLTDGAALVRLKVPVDGLPLAVPVELHLTVQDVTGTALQVGVTWSNLPLVPGFLKQAALQKAFEALPGHFENGLLTLDLQELLEETSVSFQVRTVQITAQGVRISLADVEAYPVDSLGLLVEEPCALVPVPSEDEAELPEHQGYYHSLRERVKAFTVAKAPKWAQPLLPWLLAVPDFFVLMVRLAKDERVPAAAKVIAAVTVTYFISPIDLIPDFIPVIGEMDDLALAFFAIEQIVQRIDPEVVQELWPGEGRVLDLVKEGGKLLTGSLSERTIQAIRRLIVRT